MDLIQSHLALPACCSPMCCTAVSFCKCQDKIGWLCERCVANGEHLDPPFVWMNQYVNSRVHPGTFSVIVTFLPKDLANIVVDYMHQMCRHDRLFMLNLQLRQHCFLYLL